MAWLFVTWLQLGLDFCDNTPRFSNANLLKMAWFFSFGLFFFAKDGLIFFFFFSFFHVYTLGSFRDVAAFGPNIGVPTDSQGPLTR